MGFIQCCMTSLSQVLHPNSSGCFSNLVIRLTLFNLPETWHNYMSIVPVTSKGRINAMLHVKLNFLNIFLSISNMVLKMFFAVNSIFVYHVLTITFLHFENSVWFSSTADMIDVFVFIWVLLHFLDVLFT